MPKPKGAPKTGIPKKPKGPFDSHARLDPTQVQDRRNAPRPKGAPKTGITKKNIGQRPPRPKTGYTPGKTSAGGKGYKGAPKGAINEDGSRSGGITKKRPSWRKRISTT